jgi:hypothetical protein
MLGDLGGPLAYKFRLYITVNRSLTHSYITKLFDFGLLASIYFLKSFITYFLL